MIAVCTTCDRIEAMTACPCGGVAQAMLDLARPHFPTAIAAWEGAPQPA